jgi:trimethylamine--corrinoid protein Co-methyltransferase
VTAKKASRPGKAVLSSDIASQIHEASIELLENPGVRFEHEEIAKLLVKKGAKPGTAADVLRLPGKLVKECIELAPKEVAFTNRRGEKTVISAAGAPIFWSCPGLMLFANGEARPFTSTNMGEMARLLDQLENVHGVFGMAMDDVPPAARDAVGLRVMAENTSKHIRALCFSPAGCDTMVEMKRIVGEHPWFSVGFTAHGPLRWTHLALEVFKHTAGHGIPASVNGEPMAGVSGPVTLAGAAAVGNAEILAGIVVNQALEPGRPVVYNLGLAHIFDMRTAIAVTGGPENHLLAKVSAMMGRFYGLPSASWVSTESMCPDSQAALEKMAGFQTHVESGVSNVWGVGQLESEISVSFAQAVIDNEMISYVKRYLRGVEANETTLAVDVTREVGIAGSYLDQIHTAENFRSELYMPKVLFRERRANWNDQGKKRLDERAEEIARGLIANDVDNGLAGDQLRELEKLAAGLVARVK